MTISYGYSGHASPKVSNGPYTICYVRAPMHSIRQCVCPSPYVLSHELKHPAPLLKPRSLLLAPMSCPIQFHAFQRVKEDRVLARRSTWGESHSIVSIMPLNNLWVVIHRRQDCARSHQPPYSNPDLSFMIKGG